MLHDFFGRTSKTPVDVNSPDVFAWSYGRGLSGREPSSTTTGARLACLSSFYRFLIRMKVVASNLCDALERPKTRQSTPRGLEPSRSGGPGGCSSYASCTAGPRRHPQARHDRPAPRRGARHDGWQHQRRGQGLQHLPGKGGKTGKRELKRSAYEAILLILEPCRSSSSAQPERLSGRARQRWLRP